MDVVDSCSCCWVTRRSSCMGVRLYLGEPVTVVFSGEMAYDVSVVAATVAAIVFSVSVAPCTKVRLPSAADSSL